MATRKEADNKKETTSFMFTVIAKPQILKHGRAYIDRLLKPMADIGPEYWKPKLGRDRVTGFHDDLAPLESPKNPFPQTGKPAQGFYWCSAPLQRRTAAAA